MKIIEKIPGGWVTALVGGAVVFYLVNNSSTNESLNKTYDDTLGALSKVFPKGFFGVLVALAAVGGFLNKETTGKVLPPTQ